MNKIHRTVWSESRQAHVVAHEGAATRGMPSSTRSAIASAVVVTLASMASAPAMAIPGCPDGAYSDSDRMFTVSGLTSQTCFIGPGESLTVDGTASANGAIESSWIGVVLHGSTVDTINNSGSISGVSAGISAELATANSIANTGSISGGIGIFAPTTLTSMTNSGFITGIYEGFHASGSTINSITNSGSGKISGNDYGIYTQSTHITSINNSGTISANANAIAGFSSNIGSITNSGTISGGGFGIYAAGSSISGITNSGTISAQSTGIGVNYSTINDITNSGTISGVHQSIYVDSESSLLSITIDGNSTAKFIGTVFATNTPVSIASGATYTLRDTDVFWVKSFTNNGTAQFAVEGPRTFSLDLVSDNTFVNNGTLAVAAGTTGTLTGNYTQSAEGVLRTHIADEGTYGQLVVTGTATLPSNAKIDVNVATPGFAFNKTSFDNIISAGTLLGGDTFTVTDNSLLFEFSAVKDNDNTVDLTLAAAPTSSPAPAPAPDAAAAPAPAASRSLVEQIVRDAGNSPALPAARVLGQLFANDPTGAVALMFVSLGNNAAVNNAVTQTLPSPSGGNVAAAHAALGGMSLVIRDRIAPTQDLSVKLGLSSGDGFYGDQKVWVKPFGSWADQGDRSGASGYKASTSGLAFGADATVSDTTRLGVSLAYAAANTDGKSSIAPNRTNVDVYQLIGYGSHSLDPVTDINFQAGLGQNKNKGQRSISFAGTTASGSFDSLVATLGGGVSRSFKLGEAAGFTPSLQADYTWIKDSAYTERGAGALNLNVAGRTTEELILAADGKLSHRYASGTSVTANLGLGYDTLSKQSSITAAFAGAPGLAFTTQGIDPSPWLVRGGLGIATQTQSGMEISARYDVEYREAFLNQTASVKLRWAF
ncbi:autotransporter domain-containing protein [Hydrogenophaga sp. PAMC20947]|uniref:autotransporter outer membrane beta-barrel domain-containing protein n=1 Tax=Hydrogenophaga sp. PAMC20947 TaxID=2565558 RepID=UPI001447B770|nr:autotransporter domain-containing protein [Hydrogenophaga sp. PAMC20947]